MRAFAVGVVLMVASLFSCATATRLVKETRHCAEPALAARLPALIPVVLAVLDTGGQSVHDAAMSALEAGIDGGRDVLVCAVDVVLTEIERIKPKLPAEFKTMPTPDLELRARAYLQGRGFTHRALE